MTADSKEKTTDAVAEKPTEYTDALQAARYVRDYIWMSPVTFRAMYGKGADCGEVLRLLSDKVRRFIVERMDIVEDAAMGDAALSDIIGQVVKLKTDLTERDRIIAEQATDRGDLIAEIDKLKKFERPLADSRKIKKSSKYYGVSLVRPTGKWKAQCQKGRGNKYLGMFVIEEEAAIAVQEKLGHKSEAARIRKILADRKRPGGVKVVEVGTVLQTSPIKAVAIKATQADDKKQKADAAEGIEKIKSEYVWRWECKGCGETVKVWEDKCPKCNGQAFEKIPVLKDPQAFLDRPEGRHSIPTG